MVGDEEGIKTQLLGSLCELPDPVGILGIVRRQEIRGEEDPNLQGWLVPKRLLPRWSKGNRFPQASMVLDTCQGITYDEAHDRQNGGAEKAHTHPVRRGSSCASVEHHGIPGPEPGQPAPSKRGDPPSRCSSCGQPGLP